VLGKLKGEKNLVVGTRWHFPHQKFEKRVEVANENAIIKWSNERYNFKVG